MAQLVGEAQHEWNLWADHNEVDGEIARQRNETLNIIGHDGVALGNHRDAGITRRSVNLKTVRTRSDRGG